MSIPPMLAIIGLGAWLLCALPSSSSAQDTLGRRLFAIFVGVPAVMAGSAVAVGELNARAERRIAAGLAHRVSRSHAVSLRVVLGPIRSAFVATTLCLLTVLTVAVALSHVGWVSWAGPIALLVTIGLVVLGVRRRLSRASIAVDPASLAIDERMQAHDVFQAAAPLYTFATALNIGCGMSSPPSWLFWLANASFGVIVVFFLMATSVKPWQPRPIIGLIPQLRPRSVQQ